MTKRASPRCIFHSLFWKVAFTASSYHCMHGTDASAFSPGELLRFSIAVIPLRARRPALEQQ